MYTDNTYAKCPNKPQDLNPGPCLWPLTGQNVAIIIMKSVLDDTLQVSRKFIPNFV